MGMINELNLLNIYILLFLYAYNALYNFKRFNVCYNNL